MNVISVTYTYETFVIYLRSLMTAAIFVGCLAQKFKQGILLVDIA